MAAVRDQMQTLGRRFAPAWAATRARRYEQARRHASGVPALAARVIEQIGNRVIDGPCVGLRYPTDRLDEIDAPVAKLLGIYEQQLHSPLTAAIEAGRRVFVDVGCAEGYYAVGLALDSGDLQVYAYDLARSARAFCGDLAGSNGCADRVRVGGRCDVGQLRGLPLDNAFLLADIEGAEFDFFSSDVVELLSHTIVIVELHRSPDDPLAIGMIDRFAPSHGLQQLRGIKPDPDAVSVLSFLDSDERIAAISEWRSQSEQTWLVFTPR